MNLFEMYKYFNHTGGGRWITNFPEKDKLCIAFTLHLDYDWEHNNDIRESCAEDGFYCIMDYITNTNAIGGYMNMFLLLDSGHNELNWKFTRVMEESSAFTDEDRRKGAQHVIKQIAQVAIKKIQAKGFDISNFPYKTYEYGLECLNEDSSNESEADIMRKAKAVADSIYGILLMH